MEDVGRQDRKGVKKRKKETWWGRRAWLESHQKMKAGVRSHRSPPGTLRLNAMLNFIGKSLSL